MRHQVPSTQHSIQHSELCTPYSVLCLSQVGLTVLGRPKRQECCIECWVECWVGEETGRNSDQQGRWSLPKDAERAGGHGDTLASKGWWFVDGALGALDAVLDSALRTLYSVERSRPLAPSCALCDRAYFQIHSNAEGSVAATALPSTWPAFRQKTYW